MLHKMKSAYGHSFLFKIVAIVSRYISTHKIIFIYFLNLACFGMVIVVYR